MSEPVNPTSPLAPPSGAVSTLLKKKAGAAENGASSGSARPGRRAAPTSRRQTGAGPVLGVHVTPHTIYAILMRPTSDGYEPVRQFQRQRSLEPVGSGLSEFATLSDELATPDSIGATGEDGVMIQFGDGAANKPGDSLFMESEFAGLSLDETPGFDAATMAPKKTGSPIVFELKDILDECQAAGFDRPALTFVIGAPEVDYLEITVPVDGGREKADAKSGKKEASAKASTSPVRRERLMSLLPATDASFEKDRVAFVPMTPRDNLRRYLAVVPRSEEPVADSLELLREQQGMRRIPFRSMSAEVPILVGMARLAYPTEPTENTAIVRVGTEDTLVILLQGDQLHHCDHMRSVTTFDGPDTICSRVLLQQDVQGVGTVHNVIVISEEREDELAQGFSAFYPEARVETLRAGVAQIGVAGPYGPLPTPAMQAAGAALKELMRKDSPFEDLNLLPKHLRRKTRGVQLAFPWHTAVVAVLLFLSVLFFMGLYLKQSSEITDAERRLAEMPPEVTMSSGQLQMRIDSLRTAQQRIQSSLIVLDSLLYGTDRWSQTLSRTNTAAAGVGNVWVEEWQATGNDLSLHGYATTRDDVVRLAGRLDASIEEMFFRDIRDYPVYEYRLRFPLPYELPATVRYLREQAGETMPVAPTPLEPLAGSVPLTPDDEALVEEALADPDSE